MSRVYQSRSPRPWVIRAARWLLKWCYDSCIAMAGFSSAIAPPPEPPLDPRLDHYLVPWAAQRVAASRRSR